MTRRLIPYLLMTVFAVVALTATLPIQAETNKHYEACQTFGGEYEERRTNCKPECEITYICRLGNGWSRVCDEQGVCEQVQDGDGASSEPEASSEDDSDHESDMSFEDCVADAADQCRARCERQSGFDALECARDCLENQEGQCEDYDTDTDSDYDESSDSECQECQDLCEDACDRFRQTWRRDECRSECKSRCDSVCDW